MSLLGLFCDVDDFCQVFLPKWQREQLTSGLRQRHRARRLSLSEVMTLLIHFHQSHYRDFKAFYTEYALKHLRAEFPGLVSYTRFVEFIPGTLIPLCAYLRDCCGTCTGISFLDSTTLAVCHNRRIHQHKVFAALAARGKSSLGWFFGFKLHLVFNDQGELLNLALTPGNVDDRKPVPKLVRRLFGKLFADKGYISRPLFEQLLTTFGIQLITKVRSNMRNQLMPLADRLLLRKRAIAESIIDQLKNVSQIEHTRHRSPINFLINVLCGLIAYCHQPKKPSLHLNAQLLLPAA
ncbi:MAG: IS982 family transposase [Chloroflexi bacterium]|nr:IS982 family transposase [Chloroflexota bacterium]